MASLAPSVPRLIRCIHIPSATISRPIDQWTWMTKPKFQPYFSSVFSQVLNNILACQQSNYACDLLTFAGEKLSHKDYKHGLVYQDDICRCMICADVNHSQGCVRCRGLIPTGNTAFIDSMASSNPWITHGRESSLRS